MEFHGEKNKSNKNYLISICFKSLKKYMYICILMKYVFDEIFNEISSKNSKAIFILKI